MATVEDSCQNDPNFAVICSFLDKFGELCGIKVSISDLQSMLEDTKEVNDTLRDLHIQLLRKIRKCYNKDKWEKAIVNFCHLFDTRDAWEIERFGYKKAKLSSKLQVLKNLLESQFESNVKFKTEVNKFSAESLRLSPIGRDVQGHAYWYQLDEEFNLRLYQEIPDEDGSWKLVCKERNELNDLINQLQCNENVKFKEEASSTNISENGDSNLTAPDLKRPIKVENAESSVDFMDTGQSSDIKSELVVKQETEIKKEPVEQVEPKNSEADSVSLPPLITEGTNHSPEKKEEIPSIPVKEEEVKKEDEPKLNKDDADSNAQDGIKQLKSSESNDNSCNASLDREQANEEVSKPLSSLPLNCKTPEKVSDTPPIKSPTVRKLKAEFSEKFKREVLNESYEPDNLEGENCGLDLSKKSVLTDVNKHVSFSEGKSESTSDVTDKPPELQKNKIDVEKNSDVVESEQLMPESSDNGKLITEKSMNSPRSIVDNSKSKANEKQITTVDKDINITNESNSAKKLNKVDIVSKLENEDHESKSVSKDDSEIITKQKPAIPANEKSSKDKNSAESAESMDVEETKKFESESPAADESFKDDQNETEKVCEDQAQVEKAKSVQVCEIGKKCEQKDNEQKLKSVNEKDNDELPKVENTDLSKAKQSDENEKMDVDNVEKETKSHTTSENDTENEKSSESIEAKQDVCEVKNSSSDAKEVQESSKICEEIEADKMDISCEKDEPPSETSHSTTEIIDESPARQMPEVDKCEEQETEVQFDNKSDDQSIDSEKQSTMRSRSKGVEPFTSSKRGKGRGRSRGSKALNSSQKQHESPEEDDENSSKISADSRPKAARGRGRGRGRGRAKSRILNEISTPGLNTEDSESLDGSLKRTSRRLQALRVRQIEEQRELEKKRKDDESRKSQLELSARIKEVAGVDQKPQLTKKSQEKKKKGRKSKNYDESFDPAPVEKKKKKKRKKGQKKGYNPWDLSTDGSSSNSSEIEVEEEEEEEEEEELKFDENYDEFAPEEIDESEEPVLVKRARTLKKEDTNEDEENDDVPCGRCEKYDHPEWILLCDDCDAGYHASCLKPPLMIIPVGTWFCPPCEHKQLCKKLVEELQKFDSLSKKREAIMLRKQRLAYVGISLDNVLKPEDKPVAKKKAKKMESEDDETSSEEEEESESESDDDEYEDSGYNKRSCRNRQGISYRFKEYDELINSAIQHDEDYEEYGGGLGKGKDMSNITNAENDEEDVNLLSSQKKKRHRLNDLSATDDEDSGEEYKGSNDSASEMDMWEEAQSSGTPESDASWKIKPSRRSNRRRVTKSKKKKTKRRNKARYADYDSESESDVSYDSDYPEPRATTRKRVNYKESSNEDSDPEFQYSSSKKTYSSARKRKITSDSEEDWKKKKKSSRISDIEDEESESSEESSEGEESNDGSERRTRAKKINFGKLVDSDDSAYEGKSKKKVAKILEEDESSELEKTSEEESGLVDEKEEESSKVREETPTKISRENNESQNTVPTSGSANAETKESNEDESNELSNDKETPTEKKKPNTSPSTYDKFNDSTVSDDNSKSMKFSSYSSHQYSDQYNPQGFQNENTTGPRSDYCETGDYNYHDQDYSPNSETRYQPNMPEQYHYNGADSQRDTSNGRFNISNILHRQNGEAGEEDDLTGLTDIVSYITQE